MKEKSPRVIIGGTNSGCGKTTVVCAILQALINRKLKVLALKCGPDYIDTMFHSKIIGAKSSNLDLFFFDENTLKYILAKNSKKSYISIIEGVMGFYDGLGIDTTKASTYEVAKVTKSPVVLVVNAKGSALSVLATINGFVTFCDNNNICGVILNQCTAMTYGVLAKAIEERFQGKIKPLGFLPKLDDCTIESRHLGLVTANEIENLKEKLQKLASTAEKYINLNGIIDLAESASPIVCDEIEFPQNNEKVRIAVAHDDAFCFYYEDSLDALREMGAEIINFSPLEDDKLPENIHGIYLGGGYPELYAEKLSQNTSMLNSIYKKLEQGIPCIAECGGFMYLNEYIENYKMVGFLKGKSFNTGKLVRFGYINIKAKKDNLLCKKGEEIKAHEFHYWDSTNSGSDFLAEKLSGKSWDCVVANQNIYAGYPHFHFYSNPNFAVNFYRACLEEKHRND